MRGGLVDHVRAVADLDHDRVQIDHRIERVQRPGLPLQDLLGDRVSDIRDRLVRQLCPDRRGEVVRDVTDRHPDRVERDDHLVQAAQPARSLRDQRRGEGPVPVARDRQIDVTDLGGDLLRARSVPRVRHRGRLRGALLVAQMARELGLQPAFQGRLEQAGDEPAIAGQLNLTGVDLGEQFVQRARLGELGRGLRAGHVSPVSTRGSGGLLVVRSPGPFGHSSHHRSFAETDRLHRPSDTPPRTPSQTGDPAQRHRPATGTLHRNRGRRRGHRRAPRRHPSRGVDQPARGRCHPGRRLRRCTG